MSAILCIGCGAVGDSDGAALYCNSCYEELQEENKRLKTLLDQLGEGVLLIAMERQRQVVEEGWTPDHDDQHKHGEMCAAAAVYAFTPKQRFQVHASQFWPWDMAWFKPGNRIRELQKAGALIAAEIDRLNRRAVEQGYEADVPSFAEYEHHIDN